jgi:hypothetical protein
VEITCREDLTGFPPVGEQIIFFGILKKLQNRGLDYENKISCLSGKFIRKGY